MSFFTSKIKSFVSWYNHCLETKPMTTNVLSSLFLFGGADIACQLAIEKKGWAGYEPKKTLSLTFIGVGFVTPSL